MQTLRPKSGRHHLPPPIPPCTVAAPHKHVMTDDRSVADGADGVVRGRFASLNLDSAGRTSAPVAAVL